MLMVFNPFQVKQLANGGDGSQLRCVQGKAHTLIYDISLDTRMWVDGARWVDRDQVAQEGFNALRDGFWALLSNSPR